MKKFMVIGLGNFGSEVVKSLFELGNEVVALDLNKECVQKISDYSTRAIIADAADKDLLLANGAKEMDAVIVSMGDDISHSILSILYLKEIGVRHIIAKANDPDHGRALKKVGADQIIFPEQEMAVKLARKLTSPSVLDTMDLSEDYVMTELLAPLEFVGKSLVELKLRNEYNVFVMAIKEAVPERFNVLPRPDYLIKDSDVLVILGRTKDVAKIEKIANKAEG
ncbi:MAG TPA: TrkA family potassium uptake protein [archaeon]|nr:TrkA family potassium uptake protein [archaeon]